MKRTLGAWQRGVMAGAWPWQGQRMAVGDTDLSWKLPGLNFLSEISRKFLWASVFQSLPMKASSEQRCSHFRAEKALHLNSLRCCAALIIL